MNRELLEWDYAWECEDCPGGQAGYSAPQKGPGTVVDALELQGSGSCTSMGWSVSSFSKNRPGSIKMI